MRRVRAFSWVLLAVVAVPAGAAPATARAQAAPSPATKGARQHFERGTALYDLRRYHEAAAEYEAAFELKSEPSLLYNIGQAYRLAGELEPALSSYRAYLRRLANAPNRAEAERHILALQRELEQRKAAAEPAAGEPPARSRAAAAVAQPQPLLTPSVAPSSTSASTSTARSTPVYKKWWLWTAVGVVVAGATVGVAVAATTPKDAAIPGGAIALQFH
jgi:iron complex outermembrane receptor protein